MISDLPITCSGGGCLKGGDAPQTNRPGRGVCEWGLLWGSEGDKDGGPEWGGEGGRVGDWDPAGRWYTGMQADGKRGGGGGGEVAGEPDKGQLRQT